uniref:Secreted protein n=1 Tax=Chlamydomonas leiostraca TaxID=1034604 RepID=A0A7S0RSN7_9CHLO
MWVRGRAVAWICRRWWVWQQHSLQWSLCRLMQLGLRHSQNQRHWFQPSSSHLLCRERKWGANACRVIGWRQAHRNHVSKLAGRSVRVQVYLVCDDFHSAGGVLHVRTLANHLVAQMPKGCR